MKVFEKKLDSLIKQTLKKVQKIKLKIKEEA